MHLNPYSEGNTKLKTLLLQTIQQPSQVDTLLHECVQSAGTLPDDAHGLRDLRELHSSLRRLVHFATNAGQSLACWADDHHHSWLFIAEMSLPLSRERGSPVLQVDRYDEDGEIQETGHWVAGHKAQWRRCAD